MKVYGIKNCNTVKKALNFLNEKGISYEFHDYKKEGISKSRLQEWSKLYGQDILINRKGTTWRKLDDADKEKANNEADAHDIMIRNTSLIKRPILEKDGKIIAVGYDEEEFKKLFA